MELPQNLRLLSVPVRLRIVLGALLAIATGFAVFLLLLGFARGDGDQLRAGADLAMVLVPTALAAILFAFSSGGVDSLRERTMGVLGGVMPSVLRNFSGTHVPESAEFASHASHGKLRLAKRKKAEVKVFLSRDDCQADYLIAPDPKKPKWLRLRLELNVKRANFVLYVRDDVLMEKARLAGKHFSKDKEKESVQVGEFLRSLFPHTLSGARHATDNPYTLDTPVRPVKIEGVDHWKWPAYRTLQDDFLWDPANQLFFCQDVMFFVRSLYNEQPNLLLS